MLLGVCLYVDIIQHIPGKNSKKRVRYERARKSVSSNLLVLSNLLFQSLLNLFHR